MGLAKLTRPRPGHSAAPEIPTCAPAQRLGDPCALVRVVEDSVTGGSNDGHLYLE